MTRSVFHAVLALMLLSGARLANGQATALVEQQVTQYQPVQQRVIVPVREYRTVTRLHGWWNPFREPHYATHHVPVTRWVEQVQTTYVPVTRLQYRAETVASSKPAPPLVLATGNPPLFAQRYAPFAAPALPVQGANVAARPALRLYDDPPMVAVQPVGSGRLASRPAPAAAPAVPAPQTTLSPRGLSPSGSAASPGGVQRLERDPPAAGVRGPAPLR